MASPELFMAKRRPLDVTRPLRVAVDTKNFALFTGGIAAFFGPLLQAWIARRPQHHFILAGPRFETPVIEPSAHWHQHVIPWPLVLPRPLRHPVYDNLLFPRALRAIQPDLIFTPYHDVRLPRGKLSVMMVHDTCLHDLPDVYPLRIRRYYLHMLNRNLKIAGRVLTVSEASRDDLLTRYGLPDERIGVVPNAIDPRMTQSTKAPEEAARLRAARGSGLHLFYPGGSEHRKNITRLAEAVLLLAAANTQAHLWITGTQDPAWAACLDKFPAHARERFHFVGRLSLDMLAAQYLACDVVVYPTLCEGFGRVALEAMELGVPLACSDLKVLREVATDYPVYFDPKDPSAIAAAVRTAQNAREMPRHCVEFQPESVADSFIIQMDTCINSFTRKK
jgi:glycosyltransferase involved in cell wall biosynthesis